MVKVAAAAEVPDKKICYFCNKKIAEKYPSKTNRKREERGGKLCLFLADKSCSRDEASSKEIIIKIIRNNNE